MTWAGEPFSSLDGDVRDERRSSRARLGTTIASTYRIVGHLGSGGSSDVYRAEHVRLGKAVAIKVLRSDTPSSHKLAQRFRREARAVARLRSEHVVEVIDFGELTDETPFLVMEFLEGHDLRQLLLELTRLPVARAVHIAAEACFGLDAVHQAGLVHRDVKPENLFITHRDSGDDWCKVLDFGIAKMEASVSTSPGAILGTIRYMAPEQLLANGDIGPHTDIYALGAILYECLSGRPAHPGATPQQLMYSVINSTPTSLAELRPELSPALVELVKRCLAKDHRRRPSSARALAAQLHSALSEHEGEAERTLSEVSELSPSLRLPPKLGPRAWLLAGASAVAATLLSSLVSTRVLGAAPSGALPSQRLSSPPHDCCSSRPAALDAPAPTASVVELSVDFADSPGVATRSRPVAPAPRPRAPEPPSPSRFDELSPYAP